MSLGWQSFAQIGFFVVVGLIITAWVVMHIRLHTKATPLASLETLTTRLRQGRPTLIYFYSNF